MVGRGKFQVIEQERVLESDDGMGLLWYTNRMHGDFILKIDWRVKRRSDNSGVFIRFSDPGPDPWNAVKTGYEIQIDDLALSDRRAEHNTGAISDIVRPATLASKQVGECFIITNGSQSITKLYKNANSGSCRAIRIF